MHTHRSIRQPPPAGVGTEVVGVVLLAANLIVWLAALPAAALGAL